ncbi:MAG TPA: polysaccharide deacetylase family protein [Stellaceae bacterium]
MTYLSRLDAETVGWSGLTDELNRWGEAGRVARFWWRDDDAIAATPQLEALLRLVGDVPVALAVIPALVESDLADALLSRPYVAVLQHGWSHTNHHALGKKSEFPASRNAAEVATELRAGANRLRALFGSRFVPILAPPWNRFAPEFVPLLAPAGILALSTMARPQTVWDESGIAHIDAHLDPVAWKADRGFIGTEPGLDLLLGHLRAQRLRGTAAASTIGILTHHLVMDRPTAAFLEQMIAMLAAHSAASWVAAGELVWRQ